MNLYYACQVGELSCMCLSDGGLNYPLEVWFASLSAAKNAMTADNPSLAIDRRAHASGSAAGDRVRLDGIAGSSIHRIV